MEKGKANAEALHHVGQGQSKKAVDKFVNPGTPDAALVSQSDMESAQVSPKATAALKSSLTGRK